MELHVHGLLTLAQIVTGILDIRQGGTVLEEGQKIIGWTCSRVAPSVTASTRWIADHLLPFPIKID